jgi:hypothetical protein
MAIAELVKDKLMGFLTVIIIISAVALLWPILQSSIQATTGLTLLSIPLLGLIISVGLLLLAVDYFL